MKVRSTSWPTDGWQGSVELGWSSGARRRKTITRRRKADVARELRALLTAVEAGQLHPDRSPTLEAWMDTYPREVAAARVRPVTLDGYRQLTRLHITPELGRHRLDQLRPQHVAALYPKLGTTLAPTSVRRVHAVLRRPSPSPSAGGSCPPTPLSWSTRPP